MQVVASHSGKVVVERRVRETVQKDGGRERESKREQRREKGGGGGGSGGEIEEHLGTVGDDASLFVQSDTNTNMWTQLTAPVTCKIRRPLSTLWSR